MFRDEAGIKDMALLLQTKETVKVAVGTMKGLKILAIFLKHKDKEFEFRPE